MAEDNEAFKILQDAISEVMGVRAQFDSDLQQAQAIEAEVESYDRAVRIKVNAQGAILDVHLGASTSKMSRSQLARLITETAQAAAQRAVDMAATHWQGILDAREKIETAITEQARQLGVHAPNPTLRPAPQPLARNVAPAGDFSDPIDELAAPAVDFTAPPTAYIVEPTAPQGSPWQRPKPGAKPPSEDDEDVHYDRFNQNPFGRH